MDTILTRNTNNSGGGGDGGSNDSDLVRKRRPLRNENLPVLLESTQFLLEDFVELEAQYIGKLRDVPHTIDITSKRNLIDLIKNAQSLKKLPKFLTSANDSILRINAYILEILRRDQEQLVNAIPVHNLSRVCYVREAEDSHIIAFQCGDKFETSKLFNIFLFSLSTKSEAETICKLIDACFELLHVERTLAMFDQLIGDEDESNCSSSISVVARKGRTELESASQTNVKKIAKVKVMTRDAMEQTTPTATILVEKTIDNFIKSMKNELTKSEYEEFGMALAKWQKGQVFEEFCNRAFQIIGPKRLYLLKAMKPFVPPDDLYWYRGFLEIQVAKHSSAAYAHSSSDSSSGDNNHPSNHQSQKQNRHHDSRFSFSKDYFN